MSCLIYNRFTYNLMKKLLDLSTDVVKCGLLTNAYTPDEDHNIWTDVSGNEVTGAGYAADGATLANKTVTQDDANNRSVFDADDVTWTNSTITARYAVLYDSTAADNLICLIDFGSDKSSNNQDFNILWHANGIILLALKAV